MGDLLRHQRFWNHTGHVAVGRQDRVRQRAHQAHPGAAVDKTDVAPDQRLSEFPGRGEILGSGTRARSGKDTDALHVSSMVPACLP